MKTFVIWYSHDLVVCLSVWTSIQQSGIFAALFGRNGQTFNLVMTSFHILLEARIGNINTIMINFVLPCLQSVGMS
jgi:hypothetical protein